MTSPYYVCKQNQDDYNGFAMARNATPLLIGYIKGGIK